MIMHRGKRGDIGRHYIVAEGKEDIVHEYRDMSRWSE